MKVVGVFFFEVSKFMYDDLQGILWNQALQSAEKYSSPNKLLVENLKKITRFGIASLYFAVRIYRFEITIFIIKY